MQLFIRPFIKSFFVRLFTMVLVLSLGIPAVALPPAHAAGTVYVNVNYDESGNAKNTKLYNGSTYSGSAGGGWGIYNTAADTDYVTIENAPLRDDYSLNIVSNTKNVSTGRNHLGGTATGNTGITGKLVFEASVYMNSTIHKREIQFRSLNTPYPATTTTNVSALTFNAAGEIRDAGNQLLAHYEKNSWYKLKMFVDSSARTVSYFVNGQYLGVASLPSGWLNVRHIYLFQYYQSALQGEWRVDDLKLSGYVPLTGISTPVAKLELPESTSESVMVTALPQDASDQRLLWSTADPTVATVTNGTVHALKEGSTTVTVSAYEGNYSLVIPLTVTKPVLPLGITLPDEVNLTVTAKQTLQPVFQPENTTNQELVWSSSDNAIAAVDASGEITGMSAGQAVITAVSTADSSVFAATTVIVNPYIPVTAVTITYSPAQISKYDSVQLIADVEPADATDSQLTWVSDHPEIVSVAADGTLKALAVGTATVSAGTANGVADSVTLEVLAAQPSNPQEYDEIRQRWKETLTGKDSLDVNDESVQAILEANAAVAQSYWESMDFTTGSATLWADLPASNSDSAYINSHYTRLKTMALSYQSKGTSLYHNSGLKDDILQAMDWMLDELYRDSGTEFGNWWNWDIGVPNRLADILILMYDELTPEQIVRNAASIDHYIGDITASSFTQTGANRSDIMLIQIRMGLVEHNYDRLIHARDGMSELFQYTAAGDGFYEDGSYVQHSTIAYTGSYGEVLIQGMGNLLFLLNGSTWEPVIPEMNNVYRWIDEGFAPILYKGQAIDMTRGRAIVRPAADSYYSGRNILTGIARIAQTSPAELSLKLKGFVKYHVEYQLSRGISYYQFPLDLADTIRQWVEDPSVEATADIQGHYELNGMARSVHRGEDFLFGVSKSSKRIATYELTNGENPKGWYTGDGMTYLYNRDLSQYTGSFWATVNWNRLPGTTVVSRTRTSGDYQNGDGETVPLNSWAGGTTLDTFGVTGMNLIQNGTQMQAQKSWFAFDNEIVALGAGITSMDSLPVETVIEQRKLKEDNSNGFSLDGEALNGIILDQEIDSPSWAYLEGNAAGSDIGYIFPDHSSIKLTRQIQEGRWSDINLSNPPSSTTATELLQNYFLTMWIDHGSNPTDSRYEYMILPNASRQATESYAGSPDVTILANSQAVQAVRENTLGVAGYNFWTDTLTTAGGVTSNKKASVMVRSNAEAGTTELAVSDPTLENQGYIELELAADAAGILSKDDRIEVTQLSPTVKLRINTAGTLGQTLLITLQTNGLLPGTPSTVSSTIEAGSSSLTADGTSQTKVSVKLKDAQGNDLTTGGETVAITSTLGTVSVVKDNHDGTYTATLTAPITVGTASVSASVGGRTIASTVAVQVLPGEVDSSRSTITASDLVIRADGSSKASIFVKLKDNYDHPLTGKRVLLQANGGQSLINNVYGVTDEEGLAVFSVTDTVAESVTYSAKEESSGLSLEQTVNITFTYDQPPSIELQADPAASTFGSVNVTVTATVYGEFNNVSSIKWAAGVRSIAYFDMMGTEITDHFTVQENGIYSVYVVDTAGNANVGLIEVQNIVPLSSNTNLIGWQLTGLGGKVKFDFEPGTMSNSVKVSHTVYGLKMMLTPSDSYSVVYVNGLLVASNSITDEYSLVTGTNTFEVTVKAQDGSIKTYTLGVTRSPARLPDDKPATI